MAAPVCPRCGALMALPPGYIGLLCRCGSSSQAPAAPTPAPAQGWAGPPVVSRASGDGGSGRPEPGGSTTKGGGKTSASGTFPTIEITEADKTAPVARDALERAEAWMKTRFYAKKGTAGSIGDEWKAIVAACSAYGMQRGEKWREWIKERWDAEGEARNSVVRVLLAAKMIEGEPPKAQIAEKLRKALAEAPVEGSTLDDLRAKAGPTVDEKQLEGLVNAGLVYEPKLGTYRLIGEGK